MYPKSSTWKVLDRTDARYVSAVRATDLEQPAHTVTSVALETQAFNFRQEPLGPRETKWIQFKEEQDVVDVIFWYRSSDGPRIITIDRLRPPLALRGALDVPHLPELETGMQTILPGRYLLEDAQTLAPEDVVTQLAAALGLTLKQNTAVRMPGGSYFPLPDSPELAVCRMAEIEDPALGSEGRSSIGSDFLGRVTVRSQLVGQAARDFSRGSCTDLRLVLADLRLLSKGFGAASSNEFTSPATLLRINPDMISLPRLTREQMRNLPGNSEDLCAELEGSPSQSKQPGSGDTQAKRFAAQNVNNSGEVVGDGYEFDAILRERPDYVGNLGYFLSEGKLYIVGNIGIRAAHSERNMWAHPVFSNVNPWSIEGTFADVPKGAEPKDLPMLARSVLAEAGVITLGKPHYLGSGTPSSGFDPGVFHLFAQQIDPTHYFAGRLRPDAFVFDSEDIIALARTGEVTSLELLVSTMLLRAQLGICSASPEVYTEVPSDLERIMSGTNGPMRLLSRGAPKVLGLLLKSAVGRRLVNFIENESEFSMVDSAHPAEGGLFDAILRLTSMNALENKAEGEMLNIHDALGHFVRNRGLIPFVRDAQGDLLRDSNGALIPWGEREFRAGVLLDESDALWISEVFIPQLIGIEKFESATGKPCLAAFLNKAGIPGIEAEQKAIRQMVMEGQIPSELAQHPDYAAYREIILGKLIGYYVRDGEINCGVLYRGWLARPECARITAPFTPAHGPSVAQTWREDTGGLERMIAYPHGRNPLKGEISRLRGEPTTRLVSQLADLMDRFSPTGKDANERLYREGEALWMKLRQGFSRLQQLRDEVIDMELSERNEEILRSVREIERTAYEPLRAFCSCHRRAGEREFPSAIIHGFFIESQSWPRILEVEAQSLQGTRNQGLAGQYAAARGS